MALATFGRGQGKNDVSVLEINDQGAPTNIFGRKVVGTHTSNTWDVAVSPDNKYIASASWDESLHIVNLESRNKTIIKPDGEDVDSVDFDTYRHLIANTDKALYYWNLEEIVENSKPLLKIPASESTVLLDSTISPDKKWLVGVGSGANVILYPLDSDGLPIKTESETEDLSFEASPLTGGEHTLSVLHAEFSANSRLLATLGNDGILQIWDVKTKSPLFHLKLPTDTIVKHFFREFTFPCTDDGCYLIIPIHYGVSRKGSAIAIYDFMNL